MKVLFVTHDAYRAGAQLMLLGFLEWLNLQDGIQADILYARSGELVAHFNKLTKNHYSWIHIQETPKYLRLRAHFRKYLLLEKIKKEEYDLIYSNTIVNGHILADLKNLNIPILTHVHELSYWIDKAGVDNLTFVKNATNKYLTASTAVKRELIRRGITPNLIQPVFVFTSRQHLNQRRISTLHSVLSLAEDTLLVGACGGEIWRKGKDLFVPLAETTLSNYHGQQPVHFVWIGGSLDEQIQQQWEQSAHKEQIHFVNHLPNAATYFSDLAVFAMLSRDDPFPTVNLEAGIRNVPVLAFAESGGSPELLERWPEQIIPFENVEAYAARILYLLNNNQERKLLGLELANHIESHFLIDHIGPQLLQAMRETIKEYESK